MTGLLIIVAVTAAIGFILWIFDRRNPERKKEISEKPETLPQEEEECCGMHLVCEKNSLILHDDKIEYYEDEELDRYRGREADDYTDEEIEEWRDVLLTLRPEEIAGWGRSIRLRELEMPSPIREELLLIVSEARHQK